jgi:Cu+-exporting ATPase
MLTALVVFVSGAHFHKSAGKKLLRMQFNMDSLVSLGTLAAFFYSVWAMFAKEHVYFEAAAAIITLINLGKWLEALSRGRASEALNKLLQLGAKKARVVKPDGEEELIATSEVKVGDILIVKAGEKVPLDGEIVKGEGAIDESMLTGESIPVSKGKGDEVFGATINHNGNLQIKVTHQEGDTILASIIKMIEDAQNSKAPVEKLVDRISGIFVPIVIIFAVITFVVWYLITRDFAAALIPAVATLVIACPCSLGLATPTAIMVGTGKGAKNGILIKNGETLEKSQKINVVVFDKTGTLTKGKPQVTDIKAFNTDEKELQEIAYSLAKMSEHPLSVAIAKHLAKNQSQGQALENFNEIGGKGIKAKNPKGELVLLGNQKLLEAESVEFDSESESQLKKLTRQGKTPVIIAKEKQVIGLIALRDEPRPESLPAISRLKKQGLKVMMITGDNQKTAEAIAKEIQIDEVIAEVLPQDKANKIKELKMQGNNVAFVGDGINDAPALAECDLGIAMGSGSDIAIETGSIILVQNNPEKVASAILLSKKTFSTIKQNLFWAFIYNTVGIPIAAFGLLSPIFASLAMSLSSVSVVTNSLRIKRLKI